LKPAFVVVTGDLINKSDDRAQAAEYRRIAAKLDRGIKLYNVAGNHDEENEPTAESLARYRKNFGPNYYSFRAGDIAGIVLDSNLEKAPQHVAEEATKMEQWLRSELANARRDGVKHIIVFQHIPFFLEDPAEKDQYFNIPLATRQRYLALLHEYGVREVFAGHYHRNAHGRDGDLEMVTSGPVGMPLEGAKSGMRIVKVTNGVVSHQYFELGELPDSLP